jgi:hypothetical protein
MQMYIDTKLYINIPDGPFLSAGKEFYSTQYQSGFLFLNQCGEWFLLPA